MAKAKEEHFLYSRNLVRKKSNNGRRAYVPISGLPSRQAGVEAIQDRVQGMIDGSRDADYTLFLDVQLANLRALRAKCITQENAFYDEFGVKDIEDLQSKFSELMKAGYWALSNVNLDGLLLEIKTRLEAKLDSVLIDLYNNSENDTAMAIFNDPKLTGEIYSSVGAMLQPILGGMFGMFNTGKRGFNLDRQGSIPNELKYKVDNYVKIVEVAGKKQLEKIKALTPWMRERLLITLLARRGSFNEKLTQKEVSDFLRDNYGKNAAGTFLGINIKAEIQNLLGKYIKNNPSTVAALSRELEENFLRYSVNSGKSSIKGFLGELQFNTMIKSIFPVITQGGSRKLYEYFATGSMIDMGGKQFGVDATLLSTKNFLRRYNFQVKNVALGSNSQGNLQWKDTKTSNMDSFMSRAGISDGGVISDFFGSWGFNQIFPSDGALGHYDTGGYAGVYGRFNSIAKGMDKIFLAYADKIMRVDQIFQSKDSDLFPIDLYINTFFVISGNIIPASKLINGIMISMKSMKVEAMINMDIDNVGFNKPTSGTSLYDAIVSQAFKENPMGYHASGKDYAAGIKMKYTITVDLNRVMSAALQI